MHLNEAMIVANANILEANGFRHKLTSNKVAPALIEALVLDMDAVSTKLKTDRQAVEAGAHMGNMLDSASESL